MPVDANIFQQYLKAPKSVGEYTADFNQAESNKLSLAASRMAGQQAQQGMADEQAVRSAYQQSGGDQNKLMQILQNGGQFKAGQALQKQMLDSQKLKMDSAKTEAEVLDKTLSSFRSYVPQVGTPEQAGQYAASMFDHPVLGKFAANFGTREEAIKRNIDSFTKDPRAWMVGSAGVTADKLLESMKGTRQNINVGGNNLGQTVDYYGGIDKTQNTLTPITQSADSVASNATQQRGQNMTSSTAAAGRAQSASQFKVTSGQRERELNESGGVSNPSVLGVPSPTVTPWANQSNSKDANKVKAAQLSQGSKEIEKDSDAARKERDAAAAAKRFMELNKTTNTGGLTDRFGITRSMQGMGTNYSEMEAITAKLAPAMREPGSGSTSDFDGKQFERATVGVDKPGKTNTNIAKGMMARAQQAQEYTDFRQTYLEQNGTLQGADRYWKEYSNKNPIFDPQKEGTFELNTKRQTWNEHFKSAPKGAPKASTGESLSSSEQAELAALRRSLGK